MIEDLPEEIWKPIGIAPWDKLYEVSNLGRIRTIQRLASTRIIDGYICTSLSYKGQKQTVRVHRLIASAFLRAPMDGEVVNHINSNRSDNRIENLEWTTVAGNHQHMHRMGRASKANMKINIAKAVQMHIDGHSMGAIGRHFGTSTSAVCYLFKRMKADGRLAVLTNAT